MSIIESIFGKSQQPIWEAFAMERNGILKSESGDLFVEYEHSNYIFKIKNYNYTVSGSGRTESFMVGMAEFLNPTALELQITKEDWFASILKIFRNKDITIGHSSFDKQFVVTSNRAFNTITVLKDKLLLEKIISFNPVRIEITKNSDFGETPSKGKYMLYCAKQERFQDLNQLNEIHSLLVSFTESLEKVCQIQ